MSRPTAEEAPVCAVVVTRRPDQRWPDRFSSVAGETETVVVVDNGSDAAEIETIGRETERHRSHLVVNGCNRGFAAALNQGAAWAFSRGYGWVLLFDQDTEPWPGIGAELLRIYQLASAESATGVVGSNFLDDRTKSLRFPLLVDAPQGWARRRTVIASGSLIERGAFEAVGPFREEFFVDSVDHDFCLRARAKGLQVVVAARPLMRHSIGEATVHRLAGLPIATSNHAPDRRYWMARNRLVLCREYAFREPGWAGASLLTLFRETVVMLAFEHDRARKIRSVVAGVLHGLLGTGRRSGSGHPDG